MQIDFETISGGQLSKTNGIWRANAADEISYPADGNQQYFAIEDGSFWFRHRNHVIESLVNAFSPKGTFLDIGGGNGFVAKAIQNAGLVVGLIEPGIAGAQNAKKRGIANVVNSTLQESHLMDASCGAAGVFDVIEHIDDAHQFLLELNRVLRPEGLLFVTVPALNWLWSSEDALAGHFRRYTKKSASKALERAGFRVEYSSYFFQILTLPIFLRRTLPTVLGFRKSKKNDLAASEHSLSTGSIGKLVQKSLNRELEKIARLESQRIGSSCVLVARKLTS